jgi:aminoglycoside phosphotransferase (APT) family kinase protein
MTSLSPAGLDVPALSSWFALHVPGADGSQPLTCTLVAGGRSNLTFFVDNGEQRWVLRRPPLGSLLPSAHDMGREVTVLRALAGGDVPVPRVRAFCEDVAVIGAPFYVMERVDGTIIRTATEARELSAEQARAASLELIDVLVRIHAVDWRAAGLAGWGRPDEYLARQVRRWRDQWARSRARELSGLDELGRLLAESVPPSPPATIVHGDFRLDNAIFDTTAAPRVLAMLDWEMSTLGDPLTDLGLLMVYWDELGDTRPPLPVATRVTAAPGFLTRDQMVEEYVRRSGRAAEALPFYVVLGYFKLAIILEGIHRRHVLGFTVGDGFEELGAGVSRIVEVATDLAWRSGLESLGAR